MATNTVYTFKQFQGTLDGQTIDGFWDGDDAVEIEPLDDQGMMLIGADGTSLFSQYASKGARVTLRLQHTSPTNELLYEKERAQRQNLAVNGFPLDLEEVNSGEGGNGDRFYIEKRPTKQYGKEASVRVWTLVTGDWEDRIPHNS